MNLTDKLDLTLSFTGKEGCLCKVNQNGEDQSRDNVSRFNTLDFDGALSMVNHFFKLDINAIYYADHYAGKVVHDNNVTAQQGRSSLRFELNSKVIRDISLVVNPDSSKFMLVREPNLNGKNGKETAFHVENMDCFFRRLLT